MMRKTVRGGNGGKDAPPESMRVQDLVAAAPKPTSRHEVRVGFFVLVGFLAVVIAIFMLTDVSTLRNRYVVTAMVPDAGGMRKGDPVQMLGVNIGRVRSFELGPGGVAVRLELNNEYPVPLDSRVVVSSGGLLGGSVAEVIPGSSPQRLGRGALVQGTSANGVFDTAADLGLRADTVLTRLQAMFSEQTVGAVGTSAVQLQTRLAELSALAADQHRELNQLSASLRRSAQGVESATAGPELANSIARIDQITQRLDATVTSLDQAGTSLATVIGRLEQGDGTLGKLMQDDELYNNLNTAAFNLNALAEDIRENPRRYINVRVF
jgi:phospholipid/cholesterol/gamma-HCH transport system substrate-binding protein